MSGCPASADKYLACVYVITLDLLNFALLLSARGFRSHKDIASSRLGKKLQSSDVFATDYIHTGSIFETGEASVRHTNELSLPDICNIPKECPDDSSYNVCQVGYVIPDKYSIYNLSADIQYGNKYEC